MIQLRRTSSVAREGVEGPPVVGPLGSRPQTGSGGGLGWSPNGVWGGAPTGLEAESPRGLERSPGAPPQHDSIKPAGLVHRELPNFSESSLAGGV